MVSAHVGAHHFQLRAGAIVLDGGHVLLHRLEGDRFWAVPGGRVEAGESGSQTIVREFKEELGLDVDCGALLGVGENFFVSGGQPQHELGLYFAVTLPMQATIRDKRQVHAGIEGARRLDFKWFALTSLPDLDLRPAALREALATGSIPPHFVQRA